MFGLFGTKFLDFQPENLVSTSAFQRLNEFQSSVSYKSVAYSKCVCMWKTGNLEIPSRKQAPPPRWQPWHYNFKLPWSFSAPGEGWASPGSNTRASYKIRLTLEYVNIDVDLFLSILLVYRTEDRWNRLLEITALGARCALTVRSVVLTQEDWHNTATQWMNVETSLVINSTSS